MMQQSRRQLEPLYAAGGDMVQLLQKIVYSLKDKHMLNHTIQLFHS